MIEDSRADVLWIGLSTPKQEKWMYEHCPKLTVPAVLGVGAAFDLNTGRLTQAPAWMRENGLEWAFRLLCRAQTAVAPISCQWPDLPMECGPGIA